MPQSAYLTPFQIDHIIAGKHGGPTTPENLALSCFHCNVHKGPNIAGIDPMTSVLTRLFHPRQDDWAAHFQLHRNGVIEGSREVGRTTVVVLNLNEAIAVTVRSFLIGEGDAIVQSLR